MSEKRKPKKSLLVRLDDEQHACIINHASHSKPLYHIHVDPAKDWAPQEWEVYW